MKTRTKLTLLTGAIVFLLLGWLTSMSSFAADNTKTAFTITSVPQMNFSKASDMRANTRSLFEEHTVTAGQYLMKMYDGKNTTALKNNLNNNTVAIGDMVEEVYGTDVKNQFVKMWNSHIMEYENYTKAVKSKDDGAKGRARGNLHRLASTMEQEFDQLNKTSVGLISDMMTQHVDTTLALIDAHAAKNDTQEATLMKRGFDQAGQFGDYLTQIIATEKPNLVR